MNWLRNFMYGRYGVDRLSIVLMALAFILSVFLRFVPVPFVLLIAYIPLGYAVFRILSKNIPQRQRESEAFMRYYYPAVDWLKKKYGRFKQMQTYKFYKCPGCQQQLRVPRGRGRIEITCPKCKTSFVKKT